MATRKTFADHVDAPEGAQPDGPSRPTYACRAYGCKMAGTIDGVCSYHWSANPGDWQRVTGALVQVGAITREINRARRLFNDIAADPATVLNGHYAAMERLQNDLTAEQRAFLEAKPAGNYHGFVFQLEMLVGQAVQRVIHKRREEKPRQQPAESFRRPADVFDEMYP